MKQFYSIMRGVRIEDADAPSLMKHARGDQRSDVTEARVFAGLPIQRPPLVKLKAHSSDEVERDGMARREWLKGRRGIKPVQYAEFLFAGPPPYESDERWPADKEREWAHDTIAWLDDALAGSMVVSATLHRDESSPHIHVILRPAGDAADGSRAWGMNALLRRAAQWLDGKEVQTFTKMPRWGKRPHKQVLSDLQTDYNAKVGIKYGLERGTIGSAKEHEAVSEVKSIAALRRAVEWRNKKETKVLNARIERHNHKVGQLKGARDKLAHELNEARHEKLAAVQQQRELATRARELSEDKVREANGAVMVRDTEIARLKKIVEALQPLANEATQRRRSDEAKANAEREAREARRKADHAYAEMERKRQQQLEIDEAKTRESDAKRNEMNKERPSKVRSLFGSRGS